MCAFGPVWRGAPLGSGHSLVKVDIMTFMSFLCLCLCHMTYTIYDIGICRHDRYTVKHLLNIGIQRYTPEYESRNKHIKVKTADIYRLKLSKK